MGECILQTNYAVTKFQKDTLGRFQEQWTRFWSSTFAQFEPNSSFCLKEKLLNIFNFVYLQHPIIVQNLRKILSISRFQEQNLPACGHWHEIHHLGVNRKFFYNPQFFHKILTISLTYTILSSCRFSEEPSEENPRTKYLSFYRLKLGKNDLFWGQFELLQDIHQCPFCLLTSRHQAKFQNIYYIGFQDYCIRYFGPKFGYNSPILVPIKVSSKHYFRFY